MRFCQSQNDFPLFVSLGDRMPSFGLSRWKEKNCLRFIPSDDEGFILRGNKKQLFYKGRRRSHRFTIHDDLNFEYDCILLREPESNIITLRLEGAEQYDFFRQPDFVPDEFLKGSYAVYKKETFIGQGTGKLCHIYRPLIIDALGRKVWGELEVVGKKLKITIPEWWLSMAKYPVTVDPNIGTTTVGSQYKWYPENDDYFTELYFEMGMPVNRFLVSEAINGLCTAYFYTNTKDGEGGGRPIIYSDNSNKPNARKTSSENFINLNYASSWRSGTFQANNISAGSYIWFGLFCEYFWFPRFDYSLNCYVSSNEDLTAIPATYPMYSWVTLENFKLSMYFSYTSAQNYTRTLTQGVDLSDNKKFNAEYKRTSSQTIQLNDTRNMKADYKKDIIEINRITDTFYQIRNYLRCLKIETVIIAETERSGNFFRTHSDTVNVEGFSFRHLIIFIKLFSTSFVRDFILKRFLVSKEQIELKSLITKYLNIESKL